MDDLYLGTILLFPYGRTPYGALPCDGRALRIRENQELFSVLGTRHGGDGKITFALPNMQGLEPVPGIQYYIITMGYFPVKE